MRETELLQYFNTTISFIEENGHTDDLLAFFPRSDREHLQDYFDTKVMEE